MTVFLSPQKGKNLAKKKHESFERESRRPDPEEESRGRGKRSGRPPTATVPGHVAEAVLKLYVDSVRYRANENWTPRQINAELFEPRGFETQGGKSPRNGLGALLSRKSIPRLTHGEFMSNGLINTELRGRFEGSLQILYHPYVQLLSPQASVRDVHGYLLQCRCVQEGGGYFAWRRGRAMRYWQDPLDEQAHLLAHVHKALEDEGQWRRSFFDFLAISLGLMQEASLMQDAVRFACWRDWLLAGMVSVRQWRFCSEEAQDRIDALVAELCRQMQVKPIDPVHEVIAQLMSDVLDARALRAVDNADPEFVGALIYCLIRDGRVPSQAEVTKFLRMGISRFGTRAERAASAKEFRELGLR